MPANYTGDPAAITARQAVVVSNPVDGDALTAASNNAAIATLADILKYAMDKMGIIDTASTWTALQTMSAGLTVSAGTTTVQALNGGASSLGAITTSGNVTLTGSNPAANTPFTDVLTPTNIPKAWGKWTTDAADGIVLDAGFNVDSLTLVDTAANGFNDGIDIELATAWTGSAACLAMSGPLVLGFYKQLSFTDAGAHLLRIAAVLHSGAAGNIGGNAAEGTFVVFAAQ
jgi:hypothetical protein